MFATSSDVIVRSEIFQWSLGRRFYRRIWGGVEEYGPRNYDGGVAGSLALDSNLGMD